MDPNINYAGVVWRLVKAVHCTENEAWDAVNQAFLRLYENPPDEIPVNTAQWAELFFVTAKKWWLAWKLQPCIIQKAVETRRHLESAIQADSAGRTSFDERVYTKANADLSTAYGYASTEHDELGLIADLVGHVPQMYKISTLIVVKTLLDSPPNKPVSVETCRKILQKHKIPDTSEQARQVFTFLTTLKEVL